MSNELKTIVWEYIDTINRLGDGSLDPSQGDRRRRKLHKEIMTLTGLSAFEFGGLPFWYRIETVDHAATRLYNALMKQVLAKKKDSN